MQTEPERLGAALGILEDAATEVHLSAASSWEIAVKWALGKLPLPEPPNRYVPDRMRIARIDALPVHHRHTLAVADLPFHHRDPFDRLLVAQSIVERMPLVTADAALTAHPVELIQVAEDRPGQ